MLRSAAQYCDELRCTSEELAAQLAGQAAARAEQVAAEPAAIHCWGMGWFSIT